MSLPTANAPGRRPGRAAHIAVAALALAGCARAPAPRAGRAVVRAPAARAAPPPAAPARVLPPAAPAADGAAPDRAPQIFSALGPGVSFVRTHALGEDGVALEWLVVRVDLARRTPAAEAVPGESLASFATDRRVLLAVDGGFFAPDHRPAGLLVVRGRTLASATVAGGSGTLLVRGGVAQLLDAAMPLPPDDPPDLAVQCGPRLVEPGGVVGIYRDDGHRAARTAACLRDGGRTLDLVLTWYEREPGRGPGLLHFARLLAGPSPAGDARSCEAALNLDGGPSTGIYARDAPAATHAAVGPVPWALTVRD